MFVVSSVPVFAVVLCIMTRLTPQPDEFKQNTTLALYGESLYKTTGALLTQGNFKIVNSRSCNHGNGLEFSNVFSLLWYWIDNRWFIRKLILWIIEDGYFPKSQPLLFPQITERVLMSFQVGCHSHPLKRWDFWLASGGCFVLSSWQRILLILLLSLPSRWVFKMSSTISMCLRVILDNDLMR